MTCTIDPQLLYANASFFLDYIKLGSASSGFFEHSPDHVGQLVLARHSVPDGHARETVCDALFHYNRQLDASSETLANIKQLENPSTLCVIGGQQAGFLGGPLFVLYKIASILRTASWLSTQLETHVVPIFWLATEDHDFAEINHLRWLDASGSIRTLSFDWSDQGHPIEDLHLTPEIRRTYAEAADKMPFSHPSDAALFAPHDDDDYGSWHARIWSRLFAKHGLILVEPHVLRPLAKPFFVRALSERQGIQECLATHAAKLNERGFDVPLDPSQTGTLFDISKGAARRRVTPSSANDTVSIQDIDPKRYSTDAALRPLLADSLLPTVANVLGPSELAYHAMLMPLYRQWNIPQPLAVPRQGATLMTQAQHDLLERANLQAADAVDPTFDPSSIMHALASDELRSAFNDAHNRLEQALYPLRNHLASLDPGLDARWRQTTDQAKHQVDKLKDRAIRAEMARRGVPAKQFQRLKAHLRPMDQPQERILSVFSIVAAHGVEWLEELITHGEPIRFKHQVIVTKEPHE